MPQLDVFHVVEDGIQALSLVDDLVGRDENKLRVLVDEFLDEPWAGDPVDLDVLARDPFHAILQLPCIRTPPSAGQYLGRCETAHCRPYSMEERSESRRGQSIFSPPGPSFSQVLFAGRLRGREVPKTHFAPRRR